MEKILNYNIIEKIRETRFALNYLCTRDGSEEKFIVKLYKIKNPTLSEIARFKHEFEHIKNAGIQGTVKIYDIIDAEGRIGLVFEDVGGVSLREVMDNRKIPLSEILKIAADISGLLGSLHKNDIIHGNVKPCTIYTDENLAGITITDFRPHSLLTSLDSDIYNSFVIREVLPYMSPEQTGRVNRTVDYRTDLYSLGVTLYEMLTGAVPFISSDPMEIFHSQIALMPKSPSEIDYSIPEVVSFIVLKLLSKNAEERYQNGFGLMYDLLECRMQFVKNGTVRNFDLGRKDVPVKYIPPKELAGRKKEINLLIETFKRVSGGSKEMTLVSGPPGIGKTALVNEINQMIVINGGYFIAGKYDLLSRDVPFGGIIAAFKGLIKQMFSENREKVKTWKAEILEALSPNARIIISIIPDLELVIGAQPPVPELGAEETRNRFNLYFERFVNVFAKAEHPLVLFLDDLQWADQPSLMLINNLMTSVDVRYLFIIGAYRGSPELYNTPLLKAWETLEEKGSVINLIKLAPLSERDVRKLTVSLLKCSEEDSSVLSKIILKKTGGNPFFINQFLQTANNENLLSLAPEKGWQWDIKKINELEVTENVVGLLSEKIKRLPRSILDTLKVCSCIGGSFDVETVSSAMGKPLQTVLADLSRAVELGFIGITGSQYKFQHDRIRETSYSFITDDERPVLHNRIGRIIFNSSADGINFRNNLFHIVDQMNLGSKVVKQGSEQEELARLNLEAGEKAMSANAHGAALIYFKSGIDILGNKSWERHYSLTLKLHEGAAEAGSLAGKIDIMDGLISTVVKNARTTSDKISVYGTMIKSFTARNRPLDATMAGLNVLSELGLEIPRRPNKLVVMKYLFRLRFYLIGKKIEDLSRQPEMTDQRLKNVLSIIALLTAPSFVCDTLIYIILILEATALSIKHGFSPIASQVYANYGVVLCGLGNINSGVRFGEMALRLLERPESAPIRAKTLLVVNNFIFIWRKPAAVLIQKLKEAYNIGLETGDFEFAAVCAFAVSMFTWAAGDSLNTAIQNITFNGNLVAKLNQKTYQNYNNIILQDIMNLVNPGTDNCTLSGGAYDENTMLKQHIENNDKTALCLYNMCKTFLNFYFERYSEAYNFTVENRRYMDSLLSSVPYVSSIFIDTMVRIKQLENLNGFKKLRNIINIKNNQRKMRKWAMHAPMNYEHLYHLVEAEMSRIKGNHEHAEKSYESAIDLSRKSGFLSIEALSSELAAKYYIGLGKMKLAGVYMSDAYACYARWGAAGKTGQMEERYAELIKGISPIEKTGAIGAEDRKDSSLTPDMSTIVKASQAISGEIELAKLLKKMIGIIMENAGAEKCFLILEEKDKLYIQAEGRVGFGDIPVLRSIPLENCGRISEQIVNYVERTGETLILGDASSDSRFIHDPYIIKKKPKSVLCTPITNQNKLIGILYLENNLSTYVFTGDRDSLLKILSAQAAISIDNARLIALEREKSELEKEFKEVKFKVLQDRMSPHFLFNSLNSIISLMRVDTETASRAAFMLADNYRFLMDDASKPLIPFDRAWDFANNYLQMEKFRFCDILSIEVEKKGDFSGISIPPLIIQPLLENVIKHGEIFTNGSGFIRLSAVRNHNDVFIEIIDNGRGLSGDHIYSRTLGNILNRIKFFNPDSELTLSNRDEGGVRAVIKLVLQGEMTAKAEGQKVVDNTYH